MGSGANFDISAGHRWFSTNCFNQAWALLDLDSRTAAQETEMLGLCHAAVYHWTQRSDCTPINLSIGYWQLSRAYAVCLQFDNALRWGQACLDATPQDSAFYVGYAHEALTRSYIGLSDEDRADHHLSVARGYAAAVRDGVEREGLLSDLAQLASKLD